MGFIKRWNADDVVRQVNLCASQMRYRGNDGYIQWDCKKDLLTVKYELERLLRNSPSFGEVETSFVDDMEKQQSWEILKNDKV